MIKFLDLKKITSLHKDEVKESVGRVIESGWYLRGEATKQFEEAYAQYIGTKHCVGCGNGLDALTLILKAYIELGAMQLGDEVIVPANTYIASILAITRAGLTPVLVEPRKTTLQIDDNLIEAAINPRTRAIMIVHLYGKCAYTERIGAICKQHNLKLIEDNAQAHGCRFLPSAQRTGALGDAAAHSFYPTKNLGAMGDAGAVTTNDTALAAMVNALANYGSAKKYVFDHVGVNSRMDEMQAAVLLAKLKYVDTENEIRRKNALFYYENVHNDKVMLLPKEDFFGDNVFHLFPILCERRDELKQFLLEKGIQTDIHYPIPPHKQKCYAEWNNRSYPLTEYIHFHILSLPVNQTIKEDELKQIVDAINEF